MSTADAARPQYAALPYPPWNRGEETRRLVRTWLDALPMLNHYGFAGRQTFRDGFRALVASGGTGDATIFLAEQLRDTNAEVVHLDATEAGVAIARERAQLRGLANIRFVRDSLLSLPQLGLGAFDYINGVGLLHHLDDPDAALDALLSSLAPDGALGLMLHATPGRVGVHQLQALLRLLDDDGDPLDQRIATARQVLATLPPTNWFKRTEPLHRDHIAFGDAGIVDLLLRAIDRPYAIGEVHEWLVDRRGLHLELTDAQRGRSAYEPAFTLGPDHAALIDEISALPARRRHEIAELLSGTVIVHTFYATRGSRRAPYGARDYVPFLFHEPVSGAALAALLARHGNRPFLLTHQHSGVRAIADPGRYGRHVLSRIDGQRTFGEIFDAVRAELAPSGASPGDDALFEDFRPLHDLLASIDRLLLRHRDAAPVAAP